MPTPGQALAISSDMLVEGRHFLSTVDSAALGPKALAVNLSDLAACGATPCAFTLALALPQANDAWLRGFAQGLWALADAHGTMVVPHGSSVYSYHFVVTRHNSPFAEFLMMAPQADKVVPMFNPLLLDEPVPVNGRISVSALDRPGFGVQLNPQCSLHRPYTH
jgi:hypothetical protein